MKLIAILIAVGLAGCGGYDGPVDVTFRVEGDCPASVNVNGVDYGNVYNIPYTWYLTVNSGTDVTMRATKASPVMGYRMTIRVSAHGRVLAERTTYDPNGEASIRITVPGE